MTTTIFFKKVELCGGIAWIWHVMSGNSKPVNVLSGESLEQAVAFAAVIFMY